MNGKLNKDGTFEYNVRWQFRFNPAYPDLTNEEDLDSILKQIKKEVIKLYQEDLEEYGKQD